MRMNITVNDALFCIMADIQLNQLCRFELYIHVLEYTISSTLYIPINNLSEHDLRLSQLIDPILDALALCLGIGSCTRVVP